MLRAWRRRGLGKSGQAASSASCPTPASDRDAALRPDGALRPGHLARAAGPSPRGSPRTRFQFSVLLRVEEDLTEVLADVAENIFNRKLLNKFWHLAPKEVKELSDIVYKKIEIP